MSTEYEWHSLQRKEGAKLELAKDFIRQAGELNSIGKIGEAADKCREAVRLEPYLVEGYNNLSCCLRSLGSLGEAEAVCRYALGLYPDYAVAHSNLGAILRDLNRLGEAQEECKEALRLQPDLAPAHYVLSSIYVELGCCDQAEPHCREALRLRPDFVEANNTLGIILSELGRVSEAAVAFKKVVDLRPDFPQAYVNLGTLLQFEEKQEASLEFYRTGARLNPQSAICHNNLGVAYGRMAMWEEAEACYREAVRLNFKYPDAQCNLAGLLLLLGKFDEAWLWWRGRPVYRDPIAPVWRGEPIEDKVIYVYGEQGYGDTIQFCRYLPMVKARHIVFEVQERALIPLLDNFVENSTTVVHGDPLPQVDLQCPLGSLPEIFSTTFENIPATVPYIKSDPKLVAIWKRRLAELTGLRVGLVWAGSRRPWMQMAAMDRRRSVKLDALAPLFDVDGVCFISLQKGDPAKEVEESALGSRIYDFTEQLHNFSDTASLVECLDLVISVDTAVVHLTGALAKPIWMLNRFDTCWRWFLDRDDSPWYPTLRMFRQPSCGDWDSVITRVRDALQARVIHNG